MFKSGSGSSPSRQQNYTPGHTTNKLLRNVQKNKELASKHRWDGWEKSSPALDLMDSSNTPQDTQRGPVSMPPGGSEPDLIHCEADVKIFSINLKSNLKS